MLSDLINFLRSCFRPSSNCHVHTGPGADSTGRQDGLLWYKDVGPHMSGEFSMAVVQANNLLEDQSQLESGCLGSHESGPYGTFVGVYDGHGGPETARYVNNHLFQHLKRFASEQENISMEVVIKKAYQATEEGFTSIVTKQWPTSPQIAAVGSCCLVGVICGGTLYIANAGDSRAVLGRAVKETGEVLSIQLSTEHNASIESVRQELHALHPDDPQIVVLKNVWRVKGLIQISRSIGDLYLKKPEFNREPLFAKFRLREPFKRPILSSEPSVSTIQLHQHDRFIIFASDGLWEQLTNQEAVSIVQKHPHNGSAKRLVKAALKEAAKKREMRYSDLKKIDRRVRRHFHDDITVIVLFFDSDGVFKATSSLKGGPNISVKGGGVNLPHKTLAPSS